MVIFSRIEVVRCRRVDERSTTFGRDYVDIEVLFDPVCRPVPAGGEKGHGNILRIDNGIRFCWPASVNIP